MTALALRSPRRRLAAIGSIPPPRHRRVRFASVGSVLGRYPRAAGGLAVGLAAAGGGALAGPVAAGLAALYCGLAAVAVYRRRSAARVDAARLAAVDAVADLAAELRAGAPPAGALDRLAPAVAGCPVAAVAVAAAWQVSERTGAPLADVLDRVAEQLHQARRLRRTVAAHQAGTRATATLLAGLPAAGIGLGYSLGADPLAVLLRTPLGAACAALAGALQLGGLLWTTRLSQVDVR